MWAINSFFSSAKSSFSCLNSGLLVLLPKTAEAKEARDYRPIALIHSFAKLLSKLLANRLAPRLADKSGSNQSAFIKGRSILDNENLSNVLRLSSKRRRFPNYCLNWTYPKLSILFFGLLFWRF
jgi:hypothetical protein